MDNSNLIDLNREECEGGKKLTSPLIPVPPVFDRRLSDVENNPFDKILRTISNKNDPFECAFETPLVNNNKNFNLDDFENKENVGYLISPIQTPAKLKIHRKILSSPLFLDSNSRHDDLNDSITLPIVSKLQNSSLDCNISNVSLQILNNSVFNVSDVNLNDSFQLALKLPLPSDTSNDNDLLNGSKNQFTVDIPSVVINADNDTLSTNKTCGNSGFNNAFIDHSNRLSAKSSINNINTPISFNAESLGKSEISNIFASTSSNNSVGALSTNTLDNAFIIDSGSSINIENSFRKCMSARKAKTNVTSNLQHLNNSFGGFNTNDDFLNPYKFSKTHDNDSVFLEGSHLAQSFRAVPPIDFEDEAITTCTPPWLEENISFVESDEESSDKEMKQNKVDAQNVNNKEKTTEEPKEQNGINEELNTSDIKNKEKDDCDVQNAKDLLQNLSRILNKSGDAMDQRTLGENLLNSLALALNIDNRNSSNDSKEKNLFKMQRSKSDSKVNEKLRQSKSTIEKRINVPKLKIQPVPSGKLDKNLKPKSEKEKVTCKGPLKAFIPLANVTKSKNNAAIKPMNSILTPTKNSQSSLQYQIKKTSTPNDPKLKSPIAQSTPDLYYKRSSNETNKITPISKRQFGFSLSPLARPASANDISNISLNKSISPKQNCSSIPNLNTSLNKSSSLAKNSSNSSIPTITRRNSVTEINSTRNTFTRSFDNNKPVRSSQLKRSSSFQSKTNSSNVAATAAIPKSKIDNNNTLKKYGIPGKIKPLKLVPKTNKKVAE